MPGGENAVPNQDHAVPQEETTVPEETKTVREEDAAPAGAGPGDQLPHLEDAGTPEAKYGAHGDTDAQDEIRGEWRRAGEMQRESDHLREVLDDARVAVQKAEEADSMASGGLGVRPQDVQDEGSGRADRDEQDKER